MPILQDASFVCSLGWILYRLWQVYQKPNDELVDLLGLDIPPVPEVSLAGVAAESVLLYWKPSENQSTTLKYAIQVNGIKIGDFGHGDTSIQIVGLKSAHFYSIRVVATNATNFSTLGPLIRLRTKPSQSASSGSIVATRDRALECNSYNDEPASVRATPSHFEISSSSNTHQIIRELGGNSGRRTISGRHNSPLIQTNENMALRGFWSGSDDENEVNQTVQRLTEKLGVVRREQQEIDKQIHEEEQESRQVMNKLTDDRDQLKNTLKDKEDSSSDLRKHGNHLDKLNRNTQSRKAAKERILIQKRSERQKMEDEVTRWDEERVDISEKIDKMLEEKATIIISKDIEVAEVRSRTAHDQVLIKALEDDVRSKGTQIKEMEREMEKPSYTASNFDQEQRIYVKETDHAWELKAQTTQAQLTTLWQALQQAQLENQKAQERFAWWAAKYLRDPNQFAPIPALDFISSVKSNRSQRVRQAKPRTGTNSNPSSGYPASHLAFNSVSAISPTFSVTSPFFNMSNGMTVPPLEQVGSPPKDLDASTDGGAISPAANDLLPSNLFRDEDFLARYVPDNATGYESLNSMSLEPLSGQGTHNPETIPYGPHTPASSSSRAGSLFSSPHDSLHNLQNHQSLTDSFIESDRQPIGSTAGAFRPVVATESNPLAASRIASLFTTFNRQRGKSNTHESPSLGTLKQGQSQSFPRNLEAGVLDPIGSRRRRGSYGNWANPVAGLLNRSLGSNVSPEDNGLIIARTGSGRRSRLNMFGSKFDVAESSTFPDKLSTSRPSSTYSYDADLGRPSNDSQGLGRPFPDGILNRSSLLGTAWSANSGPWSRVPSRRPSVQHGPSTSNLSLGSTPLETESYPGTLAKHVSEQLPIGTRPSSSHQPLTPKLNPAAPTFKTLFGRGDSKKSTKADKTIDKILEKSKEKEHERVEGEEADPPFEDSSPPNPRLSRDAQSVNTAASLADSHDSLDRSTSGTPSEALNGGGPKETLMQKITRKSSSSKFNVPWGKERSGLFSKRGGEPSTPDEINECVPIEGQLSGSVDSVGSVSQQDRGSRTTLSWPNIRRKSKKGGQTSVEPVDRNSDDDDP